MRSSRVPLPGSTPILLARSPTDSLALALTCLSLSCLSVTRLLACVTKLNMHAANREALRQPLAHSLTHSLSLPSPPLPSPPLTCLSLSCLSVTRLLACVTKLNMHAANREALRQPLAHSLTHSLSLPSPPLPSPPLTCLSLSCLSVTRLLACVTKLNMDAANRKVGPAWATALKELTAGWANSA